MQLKKSFIVLLIMQVITVSAFAQTCKQPFLGSKRLYQDPVQKYTMAPAGYLPVFINHVSRHGARHLTKEVNTTFIYQLLLKADSVNGLSNDGKLLKEKVMKLEKVERKNVKSISTEGQDEQKGLADRMYAQNENVFNEPKPVIRIDYTKEVRTLQTSDAFLKELKTKIHEPRLISQINDTTLRFYDLSPSYIDYKDKGNWPLLMTQLKKSLHYDQLAKKITQRFFTDDYKNELTAADENNFTSDLFGFLTIYYSIQNEIVQAGYKKEELDLEPFFTCSELVTLGTINDAEDFLVKGPATDVNGIQVKIALPLLADFIKTTDDYVKSKSVNAQLRFTHAEAIAPYAALMGIATASKDTKNINQFDRGWNAGDIIELSANIQWILYQKANTGHYLVKFLLNEKEVSINGLSTKTFPYYDWNAARKFYLQKIKHFNADLNTDFVKYLKEVK